MEILNTIPRIVELQHVTHLYLKLKMVGTSIASHYFKTTRSWCATAHRKACWDTKHQYLVYKPLELGATSNEGKASNENGGSSNGNDHSSNKNNSPENQASKTDPAVAQCKCPTRSLLLLEGELLFPLEGIDWEVDQEWFIVVRKEGQDKCFYLQTLLSCKTCVPHRQS